MKVVIMGCGRVGAELAAQLDQQGHQVTVIDINPEAFRRLPMEFKGRKVVGNGVDQDVLRRVGVGEAQAFVAVTQGDNRNIMAAQMAKFIFGVPKVMCRIYDPARQEIYRSLGLETVSPTRITVEMLLKALVSEAEDKGRDG
ncbi:MAG: TrkA family potassium uptake protein [Dehalococcoidia bacterium]|jgi:trk system potassium uptake protein TrkA|nr:TrkA family potassium uptake protein [Dehalococcoidia bacterium]